MPFGKNLLGKKFGRLFVEKKCNTRTPNRTIRWECRCDCGKTTIVDTNRLTTGNTTSCGCFQIDRVTVHGMSKNPTYQTWEGMIQRCRNPNHPSFAHYGGRGIKVCKKWLSFQGFYSDMGEKPDGTSIERMNNEKGYDPDNCKWADIGEQARNKRNNRWIEFEGKKLCLADWSVKQGIPVTTILGRLKRGWSTEKSLTVKTHGHK